MDPTSIIDGWVRECAYEVGFTKDNMFIGGKGFFANFHSSIDAMLKLMIKEDRLIEGLLEESNKRIAEGREGGKALNQPGWNEEEPIILSTRLVGDKTLATLTNADDTPYQSSLSKNPDTDTPKPPERDATSSSSGDVHSPTTFDGASVVRSIEGWVVLVTNVHEEASEEDLRERFEEFGDIQNLRVTLDKRTGYVKGYAFIEYSTLAEAHKAITQTNNTKLLDQTIYTDFAFVHPPPGYSSASRGGFARRGGRGSGGGADQGPARLRARARPRSRSPKAKGGEAAEPVVGDKPA